MTEPAPDTPELTISVTVVDGGAALERCLDAVAGQVDAPSMEVVVAYDHLTRDVAELAPRYPDFRFVDLGPLMGGKIPKNEFEQHKFYDMRRAGGLRHATGRLVGMIEDRGAPHPDWAAAMIAAHAKGTYAAVGGAVDCGSDRLWSWAIFFCDYGRYQAPLSGDDVEYATDTNICYRRDALESMRHLWEEAYEEARLNWALRRAGGKLMLTDTARTTQIRGPVSICTLAKERVHWARVFGRVRGREVSGFERFKLCLGMPILPFILLVRHFRRQIEKGHDVGRFLLASPAMLFLLAHWSLGEFIGYMEAKPEPALATSGA